ncbi:MAG: NAD(P)/FAD-dependent oxidoreductase [Verrucomicrobiota bacterium]
MNSSTHVHSAGCGCRPRAGLPEGKINTVAILGGGPVASSLAILLARQGTKVAILHLQKRAPLIVGESLVPAIIPMLRELGVEDEVKSYSKFKPGATINLTPEFNLCFPFKELRAKIPPYAYNTPRDRLDDTVLEAARKAGAVILDIAAKVEKVPGTDRARFTAETKAALAGRFTEEPDLIVDATGRARVLPQALDLPTRKGPREDIALFAHVDQTKIDHDGHVHTTRLDHGWAWRIPLPDRMSLGMIVGKEFLPKYGATKEEQYDNLMKQDSVLSKFAGESKRLTPVMEYKNYQLCTDRIVGANWVLVGDTAGFIDPVFSSGLLIGMQGSFMLAKVIAKPSPKAFRKYQLEVLHHLQAWHEIVGYFYSGQLFKSFQVGEVLLKKSSLMRMTFPHMQKHFGAIFTGLASNSNYSLGLLRWVIKNSLRKEDPSDLAIR